MIVPYGDFQQRSEITSHPRHRLVADGTKMAATLAQDVTPQAHLPRTVTPNLGICIPSYGSARYRIMDPDLA
jgi:hypothetical protein